MATNRWYDWFAHRRTGLVGREHWDGGHASDVEQGKEGRFEELHVSQRRGYKIRDWINRGGIAGSLISQSHYRSRSYAKVWLHLSYPVGSVTVPGRGCIELGGRIGPQEDKLLNLVESDESSMYNANPLPCEISPFGKFPCLFLNVNTLLSF